MARIAGLACVLALGAAAQAQSVVLPASLRARPFPPGHVHDDARLMLGTPSNRSSRHQFLFGVADIPFQTGTMRSVSLRAFPDWLLHARTVRYDLLVSTSRTRPRDASSDFAANHGRGAALAFSGPVSFPPQPLVNPWPTPWAVTLPFAAPISYSASGNASLVLDFIVGPHSDRWLLDGLRIDPPPAVLEHPNTGCFGARGQIGIYPYDGGIAGSRMFPGGELQVYVNNVQVGLPAPPLNVLLLSNQGRGATVGRFTTPFPLQQAGVPSPPNCDLAVGLTGLSTPMAYLPSGSLSFFTPIPADPGLSGVVMYAQALFVEQMPTVVASPASKYTLGALSPVQVSRVTDRLGTLASGLVELHNAVAVRVGF